MMNRSPEDEVEKAILAFVTHYGLLELMTALPTTPSFMDYEAVYLPKNHFIKEESMETEDYLALFYPCLLYTSVREQARQVTAAHTAPSISAGHGRNRIKQKSTAARFP